MPQVALKHLAKKANISDSQAEHYWHVAKSIVKKEYDVDEGDGKFWPLTMGIAKKMMGLKESLTFKEYLAEIHRMDGRDYLGGRGEFSTMSVPNKLLDIPGNSKYQYFNTEGSNSKSIYLVDIAALNKGKGRLVGKLSLYNAAWFPLDNTYQVDTITTDEDYRGKGLGMVMYGIALSIMKLNLLAGELQTPDGRKQWLKLASIPGCEVTGYAMVNDSTFDGKKAEAVKDAIMSIGADYIGQGRHKPFGKWHFFSFPVKMGKNELLNAIRGKVETYDSSYADTGLRTGLIARWNP